MGLKGDLSFDAYRQEVLDDYNLCTVSRQASLLGRREVLGGKAKFGIFGDGKEVAQIALAKVFHKGDFRSGYYRDQTFMMAKGMFSVRAMFAGIYAHADIDAEPNSAGRQMVNHFSTAQINPDGSWKNHTEQYNSCSDISCTAGQLPRLLGLAQASKIFRDGYQIKDRELFTRKGKEVAFGMIGNASTSEGHFWETINAMGVMQVPIILSVWDDGYGISVPARYQTTKESVSEVLEGFRRTKDKPGIEIIRVKGWDYPALVEAYRKAEQIAREESVPVLFHVVELTQPQGHSTSGSHERYKSPERLAWEKQMDCMNQFRRWILAPGISPANPQGLPLASEQELDDMDAEAAKFVRGERDAAWKAFQLPIKKEQAELLQILEKIIRESDKASQIVPLVNKLKSNSLLYRNENLKLARKVLRLLIRDAVPSKVLLKNWVALIEKANQKRYGDYLYSSTDKVGEDAPAVEPVYGENSPMVDGRIIIRDNFDQLLSSHPELFIFGEDIGKIGDVNQGLEGMQEKHGELRVADVGIREATIMGQATGLAMRGFRPIAEVQYLDYVLYALQLMSDDWASLRYRTAGTQKVPAILRTRGHRLEGIWHSGSPMGGILNLVRGVYVLVPRNMVKTAGFYNSLMDSDNPTLIVESLNGYRLKERMPANLADIRTPIGVVDVVREGTDVTIVSYGSTFRIVEQAVEELAALGISCELIDVQSLIPLDLPGDILKSVKKTSRLVIVDEDVPGGASGYVLSQLVSKQNIYRYLDSEPALITAVENRPAYADDGDYYCKPNADTIIERVYALISEARPSDFPRI